MATAIPYVPTVPPMPGGSIKPPPWLWVLSHGNDVEIHRTLH